MYTSGHPRLDSKYGGTKLNGISQKSPYNNGTYHYASTA